MIASLDRWVAYLKTYGFRDTEQKLPLTRQSVMSAASFTWGLYWSPYGKAFFKEGHDDGWRNFMVCFEKPKTGIVIMTNSGNGEGIFKYLLESLLADSYTPIEWEGYTPYDQLPLLTGCGDYSTNPTNALSSFCSERV